MLDWWQVWSMRLSRQGYGSINEIETLPVDKFFNLIHYENYLTKYNEVINELNRKK
jgi:hypothetical protein